VTETKKQQGAAWNGAWHDEGAGGQLEGQIALMKSLLVHSCWSRQQQKWSSLPLALSWASWTLLSRDADTAVSAHHLDFPALFVALRVHRILGPSNLHLLGVLDGFAPAVPQKSTNAQQKRATSGARYNDLDGGGKAE
jgi:hypothetical protein